MFNPIRRRPIPSNRPADLSHSRPTQSAAPARRHQPAPSRTPPPQADPWLAAPPTPPTRHRDPLPQTPWPRGIQGKNVVDFLISFPCNAGQPAPQIVDGVSGGIEGALLYFVLLCLSDLGFRSPKVPADQVFGRSTLIPRQKIMLADQIPCELLLLHGPSGPVLRGGTQGRRRGRPPRPHQHRAPPTGRKISRQSSPLIHMQPTAGRPPR